MKKTRAQETQKHQEKAWNTTDAGKNQPTSKEDFPALRPAGRSKGKEKKKVAASRRPAVIIRAQGRTLTQVNKAVRETVGDLGKKIVDSSLTRDGNVKLEIATSEDARKIEEKLKAANLNADKKDPILKLVITGLEGGMEERELTEELQEGGFKVVAVKILAPNSRGKSIAFVDFEDNKEARKVQAAGKIRVGYASCNVRAFQQSNVCFKCHEEGHWQDKCKSLVDYHNCCRKCKKPGHIARECEEQQKEGEPQQEEGEEQQNPGEEEHHNVGGNLNAHHVQTNITESMDS